MAAYTLFRVVHRICKYLWIESAPHTIQALHGESMTISLDKVIVKKLIPDTMHELMTAMCEYVSFLTVARNRVMNFIRDL